MARMLRFSDILPVRVKAARRPSLLRTGRGEPYNTKPTKRDCRIVECGLGQGRARL